MASCDLVCEGLQNPEEPTAILAAASALKRRAGRTRAADSDWLRQRGAGMKELIGLDGLVGKSHLGFSALSPPSIRIPPEP